MRQLFNAGLFFLALAVIAPPGASVARAEALDKIVAVAGDDVILESELAEAVDRVRQRAGQSVAQMPVGILRSQVLDQIILTRLQTARAEQRGISISDAELDQGIARIARQNRMSVDQFMQAVRADGMAPTDLRDQVRQEMLVTELRRAEVMNQVVVTQDDVSHYLESQSRRIDNDREFHIRHILIAVPDDADEQTVHGARETIEQLRSEAMAGDQSFADLAATRSDGQNAGDGGDLGWIGGGSMPNLFTDIVPDMQPGDISPVFRGAGGFHLIKMVDARGETSLSGGEKVMVEEIKARHIRLTPNTIRNDARTRELATEIRDRLAAGADLAALAREYSDDNATANQGGELGWVRPGQFAPPVARQLERLEPGQVSPILQTRNGYVIVKVEDRRTRDQTREAIRARARQVLGERKAAEQGDLWLRKLRDEAYVDIRMEGYQPSGG